MAYIYQIQNDVNNKIYIGKTEFSIEKRFKEHCQDAFRERLEQRPLYAAIRKYGIEHFSISLIEETDFPEEREIYWIEKLGTFKHGYNATRGGDGRKYLDYEERFHGQKFQWMDVLCGQFEEMLLRQPMSTHYKKYADYYTSLLDKNDPWFSMYNRCSKIFDHLSLKCYIAENLHTRYMNGDKAFLEKCEKELFPELLKKTDILHEAFRDMWFDSRKAFGWHTLDTRFGSMKARIVSAIKLLEEYRVGKISEIEELAEPRLPMAESLWT